MAGAGNLAHNLAAALQQNGHELIQFYNHQVDKAKELALKYKARYCGNPSELDEKADICFLCVKDEAIAEVAAQLKLKETLVLHCSGSVPMELLKNSSQHYGVFYPLQTFSKKNLRSFEALPVCLEASDRDSEKTLQELALSIGAKTWMLQSAQRQQLHLAAVFANNFSNHLYHIASEILREKNIPLELLKPLIKETAERVMVHAPADVQSGPARRNDKAIIEKHLQMLENRPDEQTLYALFSNLIRKQYTRED